MLLCPGKGLVLPNPNIDDIAKHSRFLILSLPNNEMSKKSPFVIQKALKGIGGDPKSVRKLRSGDLLIETASAVQSKSFLMAKTFLDSTLTVTPHKSLNCSRGVISESDLFLHIILINSNSAISFRSPIIPTILCESQPPILNSNASTDNSLHISVPTLPFKDFFLSPTSDRVENLSTEIQLPVPLLDTSPTTSSIQPSFSKVVNKNSKRMRKRMKE
ncbi:uncharacterized protein TNCV_2678451 [Trichonephila clavipes]|nr:uncharacterized protein TNCV_2678451 [Trichonephila clavipes]